MIYSNDDMLKLLHDSKALSTWDRAKGPVFWYIAGVPGPFYVNTEIMIGAELAAALLDTINVILASTSNLAARAAALDALILDAWNRTPVYQNIVATMAARAQTEFPGAAFVSGGERRDWLFSIPFAKHSGINHVYLFKDQSLWSREAPPLGARGFHIADLINNAASYFDFWFPALQKSRLACLGTMCINSRGANGVERLRAAGQKVVAFNSVDLGLFQQSRQNGLISAETYEEIALHFASPREWALKYLVGNPALFNVDACDKKSFERLQGFLARDPWELRTTHPAFMAKLQTAAGERLKRETL